MSRSRRIQWDARVLHPTFTSQCAVVPKPIFRYGPTEYGIIIFFWCDIMCAVKTHKHIRAPFVECKQQQILKCYGRSLHPHKCIYKWWIYRATAAIVFEFSIREDIGARVYWVNGLQKLKGIWIQTKQISNRIIIRFSSTITTIVPMCPHWITLNIWQMTMEHFSPSPESSRHSVRYAISIFERQWFIIDTCEVESMRWNVFARKWIRNAIKRTRVSVYCQKM